MGRRSRGKNKRSRVRDSSRGPARPAVPDTRPAGKRPRTRRVRPLAVSAIAVVAAIAAIAGGYVTQCGPSGQAVQPPDIDLNGMPAPVARAIGGARATVVHDPRSGPAWGRLGSLLDAHHLFDDAAICYGQALALDPDEFRWAYLLAVVQDFRGAEMDELRSAFDAARALNSGYPPLFLRYGDALVRQGKLPEARDAYRRAIDIDPNFALARRGLGQVLNALGEPEAAVTHLERVAELKPEDSITLQTLARSYHLLGQRSRAEDATQRSNNLKPLLAVPDPLRFEIDKLALDRQSCLRRSTRNLAQGNYAEALVDLERLVEMFPSSSEYRRLLGSCHLRMDRPEKGRAHLEQAIELADGSVETYARLAAELEQLGQFDLAVESYRRALLGEPDNAAVLAKFALVLGVSGDLDGAIEGFERVAELGPVDTETHHNWGTALMRRGDDEEAIAHFRAAVELDPNSANSFYNLGYVLERMGRIEEAIAQYGRAVELEPGHVATRDLTRLQPSSQP